jgi:hypothetical protein
MANADRGIAAWRKRPGQRTADIIDSAALLLQPLGGRPRVPLGLRSSSWPDLWHRRGKTAEAVQLFSSVYNPFTEGFETIDLKIARRLNDEFSTTQAR